MIDAVSFSRMTVEELNRDTKHKPDFTIALIGDEVSNFNSNNVNGFNTFYKILMIIFLLLFGKQYLML